jgi:hypothetical protein
VAVLRLGEIFGSGKGSEIRELGQWCPTGALPTFYRDEASARRVVDEREAIASGSLLLQLRKRNHDVGVLYTMNRKSPVTAHKSGYGQCPPESNDWGTKPLIPDTVQPLLTEEEGLPK